MRCPHSVARRGSRWRYPARKSMAAASARAFAKQSKGGVFVCMEKALGDENQSEAPVRNAYEYFDDVSSQPGLYRNAKEKPADRIRRDRKRLPPGHSTTTKPSGGWLTEKNTERMIHNFESVAPTVGGYLLGKRQKCTRQFQLHPLDQLTLQGTGDFVNLGDRLALWHGRILSSWAR